MRFEISNLKFQIRLVPESRLLFWFALVALPFSVLGGLYPAASLSSAGLIAALVLVALVDALLAYGRLKGLSVQLPELLRVSKDRASHIPVTLRNEQPPLSRLRLGLGLPREIHSATEDTQIALPEGKAFQLDWPCEPLKRGNYRVTRAYLETPSRLGLWAVRASVPVRCEIRVYPNLIAERQSLAALFLHRGAFGLHTQRQVGKGRDFEKLREYIPGDGYDEIHWKATAKRGHPVTKVFQIERTQELYVILDASRLSARSLPRRELLSPRGARKPLPASVPGQAWGRSRPAWAAEDFCPDIEPCVLERFLTSALILGHAAEHQGDLFGLIAFTDRVQTFLRARNGRAHYNACRNALYALEPQAVTPDFEEIGSFIRTRLRRRALLIFLTSLDDPVLAESFARNLALLSGQHLVLANMLKPPGADPLFTVPGVETLDDLYQCLGGHLQWHRLRELEKVLQRRGVRFFLLPHERLASELVSQYLGVKQRQLL